jgi:hypothetical protein
LEYNSIWDFNKDIQIPKNQYQKFVERLGPSKANTRFKSNSKAKNQAIIIDLIKTTLVLFID